MCIKNKSYRCISKERKISKIQIVLKPAMTDIPTIPVRVIFEKPFDPNEVWVDMIIA